MQQSGPERKVWVFFYGSYINMQVLKEVDLTPERVETARLAGFELDIAPRANLICSDSGMVWGILTQATHCELDRLYKQHAHGVLGEVYLPEAVVVETLDGQFRPALTYICWTMIRREPEDAYVQRILGPAVQLHFPSWYVDRIKGFLPSKEV